MANDAVQVNIVGLLPLQRQLELLKMPAATRRRVLYRTAQAVIKHSKKRVREQKDLTGQPYESRKKKSRRKMLAKLARELKVVTNSSVEALIGFSRRSSAQIAAKHQHGFTETVRASDFQRTDNAKYYDNPATRKQAIALREAGFTVARANGKGSKPPTLKWVTENLTIGQAGFALKRLREWAGEASKTSWKTELPARSFLGATAGEITQLIESIFDQMKQEIKARGHT